MAEGSCNCGAVTFEVDAELKDVIVCHCSICRRATGGNGIAVVVVEKRDFRWLGGKDRVSTWSKPDADWQSSFCKICGSSLPGANDEARMYIPAGLLTTGDDKLRVAHHIWVQSKAGWDKIGDEGRQHPEAFSG